MECPSQATGVSPPREPTTCNPSEAIPMHYQPLKKTASESTATSSANENAAAGSSLASQSQEAESTPANQKASSEVTVYSKSMPVGSWHTLSKALLFRKAVICYYKLATRCLSNNSFRKTLHYLALALQCFGRYSKSWKTMNVSLFSSLVSVQCENVSLGTHVSLNAHDRQSGEPEQHQSPGEQPSADSCPGIGCWCTLLDEGCWGGGRTWSGTWWTWCCDKKQHYWPWKWFRCVCI